MRQAPFAQKVEQRREVLVVHQHRQIDDHADAGDQQLLARCAREAQDQQAREVVEDDGACQQRHELRVPPAIENEGRQAQPERRQPEAHAACAVVADQRDRQEQQQEEIGVEQHGALGIGNGRGGRQGIGGHARKRLFLVFGERQRQRVFRELPDHQLQTGRPALGL
ncbi:hypothetical protein SDC9_71160 [bioreactor metagenome]|uniref:Uncharacterized protein n=1 Tax=bioreactor metagenome TaxID=1076179 RepID=A0A644Y7Y6_9ZZZZ